MTDNSKEYLNNLIKEDLYLLEILKAFCTKNNCIKDWTKEEWMSIYNKSIGQSVEPFVYQVIYDNEIAPLEVKESLCVSTKKTILNNYRLFSFGKDITDKLINEGIEVVILKGMSAAAMYADPELRKSGDIDLLLLDKNQLKKAVEILESQGFSKDSEQHASHHIVMNYDNISIEIHTSMVEEFNDKSLDIFQDNMLKDIANNVTLNRCMGYEIPTLKDAYNGYELLIHMLQHFLREGFGLRLIIDWYMLWNKDISQEEKDKYLQLVTESKIKKFSDVITLITIDYLGLNKDKVSWMNIDYNIAYNDYLMDILKSGEFGIMDSDRMVALRDSNLLEYIRVFHRQMHLNYPKAGKVFIIWPILWIATLIIFIRNNKKLRNNSGMAYIKKAKERSTLIKDLNLFK